MINWNHSKDTGQHISTGSRRAVSANRYKEAALSHERAKQPLQIHSAPHALRRNPGLAAGRLSAVRWHNIRPCAAVGGPPGGAGVGGRIRRHPAGPRLLPARSVPRAAAFRLLLQRKRGKAHLSVQRAGRAEPEHLDPRGGGKPARGRVHPRRLLCGGLQRFAQHIPGRGLLPARRRPGEHQLPAERLRHRIRCHP